MNAEQLDRSIAYCMTQMLHTGQVCIDPAYLLSRQVDFDISEWRRGMRQEARRRGVRITTFIDETGRVWALHPDHVVTEAENRALMRRMEAMEAMVDMASLPSRSDMIREEQRKLMQVITTDTKGKDKR